MEHEEEAAKDRQRAATAESPPPSGGGEEGGIPNEIEAKLLVPRDRDMRAIARLRQLGPWKVQPLDTANLHTVYLDTPELTLAHNGVALRLRRKRRRWEMTAKWSGIVAGVTHARPELTVPLEGAPQTPLQVPSGPLATQLAALVAGRPLRPIVISDVRRRLAHLVRETDKENAGPVAELALDRVRLRAADRPEVERTYFEVEIELMQGSREELEEAAALLQRDFGLRPSADSKFARGLQLAVGRDFSTEPVPVLPADTVEQTLRKTMALHLRRLRQNDPGTRSGRDVEAVHDMRVSCRRLRAVVRALPGAPPRQAEHFESELRWLGQTLGAVRDMDVQIALVERYCASVPEDQRLGLGGFRAHLDGERQQRRAVILRALDSKRYFRLLIQLERFSLATPRHPSRRPEVREPIARAGGAAIERAFRRLYKRGQKIGSAPRPEDLHELRMRAKRLRYILEFLRDITGKPGRRLVRQLISLQDLLGAHQDSVVSAEVVYQYVSTRGDELKPGPLLALGNFMGSQRQLAEEARARFHREWRRFSRKRTRRILRRLLERLDGQLEAPPPA